MIKEMQRLMDGNYLLNTDAGDFFGSRIDLIEYLDERGFDAEQAGRILQILDSLPAVQVVANCQGYC